MCIRDSVRIDPPSLRRRPARVDFARLPHVDKHGGLPPARDGVVDVDVGLSPDRLPRLEHLVHCAGKKPKQPGW
eukprot:3245091-Prymnesium_polylepis.2